MDVNIINAQIKTILGLSISIFIVPAWIMHFEMDIFIRQRDSHNKRHIEKCTDIHKRICN